MWLIDHLIFSRILSNLQGYMDEKTVGNTVFDGIDAFPKHLIKYELNTKLFHRYQKNETPPFKSS